MARPLKFRTAHGDLLDVPQVPATRFKNEFGSMFEQVATGTPVAITRHEKPRAVLISYEEFESLMRARSVGLAELESEFDALLEGMQVPRAKAAMAAAFDAPPGRLARAAMKAVRKRPRRKAG